ncbi:MAG: NYN domain-containing protein [Actinobacteria bacterium]|nr:NYN domain-containing protein [Actinomycetota bacterium]
MKELIIIDGYNFIFNYFNLDNPTGERILILKEKLVRELGEYGHYSGSDLIVVFDGEDDKNATRVMEKENGVIIIYSRDRGSADAVIEKLANTRITYDKVFIVTSDYSQQKVVFKNNIYRKSVREFGAELRRVRRKIKEEIENMDKYKKGSFYMVEKRIRNSSKKKFSNLIRENESLTKDEKI